MNGSVCGPAEAAVRADQLLERGHLAELRVVLAEQQQVRRVGHRVLALQAHDRVRSEQLRRVLALDAGPGRGSGCPSGRRPPPRAPSIGPSAGRRPDARRPRRRGPGAAPRAPRPSVADRGR